MQFLSRPIIWQIVVDGMGWDGMRSKFTNPKLSQGIPRLNKHMYVRT